MTWEDRTLTLTEAWIMLLIAVAVLAAAAGWMAHGMLAPTAQAQNPITPVQLNDAGACLIRTGSGSPEGVVIGNVCDVFMPDHGASTVVYMKASGVGTETGWIPLVR